jgi:hypothetical protein
VNETNEKYNTLRHSLQEGEPPHLERARPWCGHFLIKDLCFHRISLLPTSSQLLASWIQLGICWKRKNPHTSLLQIIVTLTLIYHVWQQMDTLPLTRTTNLTDDSARGAFCIIWRSGIKPELEVEGRAILLLSSESKWSRSSTPSQVLAPTSPTKSPSDVTLNEQCPPLLLPISYNHHQQWAPTSMARRPYNEAWHNSDH